ncbi:SWIM zinc finger protein (macronuclear) [Tetrahymena thermophila SB210]|uniref:SWIM zinc finger protein n=1 Tax=Tetrahymena thermophila (strain SB210) TaxID=312017 RepID=I7M144_TETTS|nr:SWIM zinc finger protein [Tetrahymena thermophila SB210]EAR94212.2 SWIM zinc finger protein [Tetrahymena thermophila SB210]|eukprot:XP_001014457.2 SWIM zinc finger protein [Tetrahymena thermophila SB210]
MSRSCAYTSKIPSGFKELIDQAQDLKLFQVSENGPSQFIFKDEEGEKFRIQIGYTISCTCQQQRINNQCVHTVFVLSKKFRVNQENPIIWQGSYTDQETEDIINLKYMQKRNNAAGNNSQSRQSYLLARQGTQKIDQALRNAKQQLRQPLDEESICPICQEDMKNDQPLTYCRKKCGNNFHIKCLRVWIDHKLSSGDKITCPMCRCDMTNGIFDEIRIDEDQFNIKYVTHFGKICGGCNKKNILGNLYHCLFCDNLDLCHYCYDSMQHPVHQKFLLKKKKDCEWEIAPQRIKKPQFGNLNILKTGIDTISHRQLDLKPTQIYSNLNDYFVSCFSLFKDINQELQLQSGLSIIGQEMNKSKNNCSLCNQVDNHGLMRKLSCGHGIDSLCLKQLISQNEIECPTCKVPILKGYVSAFQLKNKKTIQNEQSQDKQTNNKEQETNQSKGQQKKSNTFKQKTLDKFKTSQSTKENNLDLALTGNLLMPISNQQNNIISALEVNGEKKSMVEIEQEGLSQNTKRSSNFRIKKTTHVTKPPNNRQPQVIKNDLNNRIREQKENLQQQIQQGEFQLIGKEIFNKKSKNDEDSTIRGNTFNQQIRRNSYKQQNNNEYSATQCLGQQNQQNFISNQFQYEQSSNLNLYEQEQGDFNDQDEKIFQQEEKFNYNENQLKQNNCLDNQNPQYSHQLDNDNYGEEEEEEKEECKENYLQYQYEISGKQEYQVAENSQIKQNHEHDSCLLEDEDEEFQRQLIEQYEKQFGGVNDLQNVQQETTLTRVNDDLSDQLISQQEKYFDQLQNNDNQIQNNERISSYSLSHQNTTAISSNTNIQSLMNEQQEYETYIYQNNNEQENLTIRGNTIEKANTLNSRGIKYDREQIKVVKQGGNLNQKIRVSKSQRINQQKHGQQIKVPIVLQNQFEIVGQSSKPQARINERINGNHDLII